jgi:group II intron reverse transcriptase/maturase
MTVSTKQQRIAELAKQSPTMSFTSLNHFIDEEWLTEAYRRIKKGKSAGCSGETAAEYGEELTDRVQTLIDRAKSGSYFAPPVKRVYIPKGDGKEKRPIGIPETEDKVLQRGVVMLLEPIYEQDFLDCAYGFRPGRSAHQALETIWQKLMGMGGGWVLDVDVRKFYDTLNHAHLRGFIRRRVGDGVILRLIDKWLKAGVMEGGGVAYPEEGTPQGGVISPMLSNIYLHHVLDVWFEQEVKPRLSGEAQLVRFADDFIIMFRCKEDALRVQQVLSKRFEKYGLTIHPEKTRLVEFLPPLQRGTHESGTFDFLGFTHYWSRSRKGNWVIKRKTARSRFQRALKRVGEWCKHNYHLKIEEQHKALSQKLRGHYNYFGITGNSVSLGEYWHQVRRLWHYWLNRRNRGNDMLWSRFLLLCKRYVLPLPRAIHSVCAANP